MEQQVTAGHLQEREKDMQLRERGSLAVWGVEKGANSAEKQEQEVTSTAIERRREQQYRVEMKETKRHRRSMWSGDTGVTCHAANG